MDSSSRRVEANGAAKGLSATIEHWRTDWYLNGIIDGVTRVIWRRHFVSPQGFHEVRWSAVDAKARRVEVGAAIFISVQVRRNSNAFALRAVARGGLWC